jgi:hypothetical protein
LEHRNGLNRQRANRIPGLATIHAIDETPHYCIRSFVNNYREPDYSPKDDFLKKPDYFTLFFSKPGAKTDCITAFSLLSGSMRRVRRKWLTA